MIHILVDSAAELGFIEASFEKQTVCVKELFRNKHGKLQASYELNKEVKELLNNNINAFGLGKEFNV